MAGKIAYIRLDKQAENGIAQKITETGVNQSEAIRLIIREWVEMKKYFVKVPIKGIIDDAGNVQIDDDGNIMIASQIHRDTMKEALQDAERMKEELEHGVDRR